MFSAADSRYVQFGCGLSAPVHWLNFDARPALRLQRFPLLGPLVSSGLFGRFPENVIYGNVVKGLPFLDGSVQLLYCSHTLAYLSLNEFLLALKTVAEICSFGVSFV